MVRMKKTELTWDKYMDYLIETIDESKFMRRAETNQCLHQRQRANLT